MIKYILPALVLLGGCTSTPIEKAPALDVVSVTNKLTLKLNGATLSSKQSEGIQQFFERKALAYGVKVKLVSHSVIGKSSLDQIEQLLIAQGIAANNIQRVDSKEQSQGDVQILAESFKVKQPKCHVQKYSNNFLNRYKQHPSFGCANSVALAQMVANPKDLVVGEKLGPTNGAKAVSSIEGYISPVDTSTSETDSQGAITTGFGAN